MALLLRPPHGAPQEPHGPGGRGHHATCPALQGTFGPAAPRERKPAQLGGGPWGPQPSLRLLGMLRVVQKKPLGQIRKDLDSNPDSASLQPWASQRHFSHLYNREVKMYGHLALGNFCLPSKDPPTPAARTVQGDWQCHLQCRIWAPRGCLLHKSSLSRGNLGGHRALTSLRTEG